MKTKIIRTSTVAGSLNGLLKGQLKFLNQYFEITAVSGYNEKLEEVKQREGVKIVDISMSRKINLIQDLKSLIKLYLYFKKVKPTVVHSITPKAGLLTMLAGKMAGVPIRMHTFTGLIFPTKTGKMQQLLIIMDKLLCWAATNIYPEGNGVKQDLIKFKITNKPLKVLANGNVNGIDSDYFNVNNLDKIELNNLKSNIGLKDDDFVFIYVGRLVKDKGINELIEAFKNITNSKIKLLLVGSFENQLDPLKKETIAEIESNSRILFQGYQNDVRPYFAISNVLIFPSYREGFPNVVMQAGAMGLPSIVTDINGCNEIVIHNENGLIIPSKNIKSIILEMNNIFNNSSLYNSLKSKSRNMIVSRFGQKEVWVSLHNEYNNLIKNQ